MDNKKIKTNYINDLFEKYGEKFKISKYKIGKMIDKGFIPHFYDSSGNLVFDMEISNKDIKFAEILKKFNKKGNWLTPFELAEKLKEVSGSFFDISDSAILSLINKGYFSDSNLFPSPVIYKLSPNVFLLSPDIPKMYVAVIERLLSKYKEELLEDDLEKNIDDDYENFQEIEENKAEIISNDNLSDLIENSEKSNNDKIKKNNKKNKRKKIIDGYSENYSKDNSPTISPSVGSDFFLQSEDLVRGDWKGNEKRYYNIPLKDGSYLSAYILPTETQYSSSYSQMENCTPSISNGSRAQYESTETAYVIDTQSLDIFDTEAYRKQQTMEYSNTAISAEALTEIVFALKEKCNETEQVEIAHVTKNQTQVLYNTENKNFGAVINKYNEIQEPVKLDRETQKNIDDKVLLSVGIMPKNTDVISVIEEDGIKTAVVNENNIVIHKSIWNELEQSGVTKVIVNSDVILSKYDCNISDFSVNDNVYMPEVTVAKIIEQNRTSIPDYLSYEKHINSIKQHLDNQYTDNEEQLYSSAAISANESISEYSTVIDVSVNFNITDNSISHKAMYYIPLADGSNISVIVKDKDGNDISEIIDNNKIRVQNEYITKDLIMSGSAISQIINETTIKFPNYDVSYVKTDTNGNTEILYSNSTTNPVGAVGNIMQAYYSSFSIDEEVLKKYRNNENIKYDVTALAAIGILSDKATIDYIDGKTVIDLEKNNISAIHPILLNHLKEKSINQVKAVYNDTEKTYSVTALIKQFNDKNNEIFHSNISRNIVEDFNDVSAEADSALYFNLLYDHKSIFTNQDIPKVKSNTQNLFVNTDTQRIVGTITETAAINVSTGTTIGTMGAKPDKTNTVITPHLIFNEEKRAYKNIQIVENPQYQTTSLVYSQNGKPRTLNILGSMSNTTESPVYGTENELEMYKSRLRTQKVKESVAQTVASKTVEQFVETDFMTGWNHVLGRNSFIGTMYHLGERGYKRYQIEQMQVDFIASHGVINNAYVSGDETLRFNSAKDRFRIRKDISVKSKSKLKVDITRYSACALNNIYSLGILNGKALNDEELKLVAQAMTLNGIETKDFNTLGIKGLYSNNGIKLKRNYNLVSMSNGEDMYLFYKDINNLLINDSDFSSLKKILNGADVSNLSQSEISDILKNNSNKLKEKEKFLLNQLNDTKALQEKSVELNSLPNGITMKRVMIGSVKRKFRNEDAFVGYNTVLLPYFTINSLTSIYNLIATVDKSLRDDMIKRIAESNFEKSKLGGEILKRAQEKNEKFEVKALEKETKQLLKAEKRVQKIADSKITQARNKRKSKLRKAASRIDKKVQKNKVGRTVSKSIKNTVKIKNILLTNEFKIVGVFNKYKQQFLTKLFIPVIKYGAIFLICLCVFSALIELLAIGSNMITGVFYSNNTSNTTEGEYESFESLLYDRTELCIALDSGLKYYINSFYDDETVTKAVSEFATDKEDWTYLKSNTDNDTADEELIDEAGNKTTLFSRTLKIGHIGSTIGTIRDGIDITYYDGDGNETAFQSNAKDIISVASSWLETSTNLTSLFKSYVEKLWNYSHIVAYKPKTQSNGNIVYPCDSHTQGSICYGSQFSYKCNNSNKIYDRASDGQYYALSTIHQGTDETYLYNLNTKTNVFSGIFNGFLSLISTGKKSSYYDTATANPLGKGIIYTPTNYAKKSGIYCNYYALEAGSKTGSFIWPYNEIGCQVHNLNYKLFDSINKSDENSGSFDYTKYGDDITDDVIKGSDKDVTLNTDVKVTTNDTGKTKLSLMFREGYNKQLWSSVASIGKVEYSNDLWSAFSPYTAYYCKGYNSACNEKKEVTTEVNIKTFKFHNYNVSSDNCITKSITIKNPNNSSEIKNINVKMYKSASKMSSCTKNGCCTESSYTWTHTIDELKDSECTNCVEATTGGKTCASKTYKGEKSSISYYPDCPTGDEKTVDTCIWYNNQKNSFSMFEDGYKETGFNKNYTQTVFNFEKQLGNLSDAEKITTNGKTISITTAAAPFCYDVKDFGYEYDEVYFVAVQNSNTCTCGLCKAITFNFNGTDTDTVFIAVNKLYDGSIQYNAYKVYLKNTTIVTNCDCKNSKMTIRVCKGHPYRYCSGYQDYEKKKLIFNVCKGFCSGHTLNNYCTGHADIDVAVTTLYLDDNNGLTKLGVCKCLDCTEQTVEHPLYGTEKRYNTTGTENINDYLYSDVSIFKNYNLSDCPLPNKSSINFSSDAESMQGETVDDPGNYGNPLDTIRWLPEYIDEHNKIASTLNDIIKLMFMTFETESWKDHNDLIPLSYDNIRNVPGVMKKFITGGINWENIKNDISNGISILSTAISKSTDEALNLLMSGSIKFGPLVNNTSHYFSGWYDYTYDKLTSKATINQNVHTNIDRAVNMYNTDWGDAYNITFPGSYNVVPMSGEIEKILNNVQKYHGSKNSSTHTYNYTYTPQINELLGAIGTYYLGKTEKTSEALDFAVEWYAKTHSNTSKIETVTTSAIASTQWKTKQYTSGDGALINYNSRLQCFRDKELAYTAVNSLKSGYQDKNYTSNPATGGRKIKDDEFTISNNLIKGLKPGDILACGNEVFVVIYSDVSYLMATENYSLDEAIAKGHVLVATVGNDNGYENMPDTGTVNTSNVIHLFEFTAEYLSVKSSLFWYIN